MSSRENADYLMARAQQAGITDNEELANFMGQMQIESGGYVRMSENLNYSGGRLLQVFNGRNGMNTREEADAIAAGGPEAVANAVYGGDWGRRYLGNTEPDDGWRFHGRGYVQLTGRDNYERIGNAIGVDLVNNPDLAEDREIAARIAVHYWESRVVPNGNEHDIRGATQNINGGFTHVAERTAAAGEWKAKLDQGYRPEVVLDNQPVDPLQSIQNEAMRMQLGAAASTMSDGLPDYLRRLDARPRDELADGVLRQGESGPAVHGLQERLADAGIADGRGKPIEADSNYGRSTREAVENAQLWSGLPVTGVADKETVGAILDPTRRAGAVARAEDAADANTHEDLRNRNLAAPSAPSRSRTGPDDPDHPDHNMLEQIRAGVRKIDDGLGKPYDDMSERIARGLLVACKDNREMYPGKDDYSLAHNALSRVDHVVLGKNGNIFAVQGGMDDPGNKRAFAPVEQLARTPVEQSDEKLQVATKNLAQDQVLTEQRELARQKEIEESAPRMTMGITMNGPGDGGGGGGDGGG